MALSVSFHGKYIPLQGVEHIIHAADILRREDISFTLIGSGQTFPMAKKMAEGLQLENVIFVERVPFEQLPGMLRGFDVSLGVFGDTDKAARVIPNKIYEAAALGRAILTADTPAIREFFTDRENILLCRRSDPKDLAAKLLILKDDAALQTRLGEGALRLFREKCTPRVIGRELLAALEELIRRA
ncbi:glycosyltransferase [Candidatus Kaiserbacteria bacterium]|nr:glycosyltransferase [Candidatus Kaiserbacteria bacterium]